MLRLFIIDFIHEFEKKNISEHFISTNSIRNSPLIQYPPYAKETAIEAAVLLVSFALGEARISPPQAVARCSERKCVSMHIT